MEMQNDPVGAAAEALFGISRFRDQQREAIQSLLDGRDSIVIHPTGGGKSLIYQISAFLLPGLTLVISPLVSLMRDQIRRLQNTPLGAKASMLASVMDKEEREEVISGLSECRILFVTPERAVNPMFLQMLRSRLIRVSQVAIDEAHSVSRWGRSFRPDYLRLGAIRKAFPKAVVSAFTGTASPEVEADILKLLEMRNPAIFRKSARRPNLALRIIWATDVIGTLISRLIQGRAAIVYTPSRMEAERLSHLLKAHGFSADCYHAGLTSDERTRAHDFFMKSEAPIMVATSAFGMGIDRPDIRAVYHTGSPLALEDWYQEAGRAGRDGLPASAELLLSRHELEKMESRWNTFYPKWKDFQKKPDAKPGDPEKKRFFLPEERHSGFHEADQCDRDEYQERRARARTAMDEMRNFLVSSGCRQNLVAEAFGEKPLPCSGCQGCDVFPSVNDTREIAILASISGKGKNIRDLKFALTGKRLEFSSAGEWAALRGSSEEKMETALHALATRGHVCFGPDGETVRRVRRSGVK